MAEVGDSQTSEDGNELQKTTNVTDKPKKDKMASDSVDKPPTPPKRDYSIETSAPTNRKSDSYSKKISGFFPTPEIIYSPEKSVSSMTCLRYCLIFFNLLIWLFGAALTALGLWIKFDADFLQIESGLDIKQFAQAANVLIVAGVIIMVIGFMGCYGAMAQKVWLLIIFSVIIVIVILMEIAVMALVWTAVSSNDMQEKIKAHAKEALQKMHEKEELRKLIEIMQSKLQCCGVNGKEDYSGNKDKPTPIPPSCTDPDTGGAYTQVNV